MLEQKVFAPGTAGLKMLIHSVCFNAFCMANTDIFQSPSSQTCFSFRKQSHTTHPHMISDDHFETKKLFFYFFLFFAPVMTSTSRTSWRGMRTEVTPSIWSECRAMMNTSARSASACRKMLLPGKSEKSAGVKFLGNKWPLTKRRRSVLQRSVISRAILTSIRDGWFVWNQLHVLLLLCIPHLPCCDDVGSVFCFCFLTRFHRTFSQVSDGKLNSTRFPSLLTFNGERPSVQHSFGMSLCLTFHRER